MNGFRNYDAWKLSNSEDEEESRQRRYDLAQQREDMADELRERRQEQRREQAERDAFYRDYDQGF